MKTILVALLFTVAAAMDGCGSARPLINDLNGAVADLSRARETGSDAKPIEQKLAHIAGDAMSKAPSAKTPNDGVALYRVAAVAAWQAGPAGSDLVIPATTAGVTACEALPKQDKDAPRDCSLIRLARPMAVQDGVASKLMDLKKKRATLQSDHERRCQELSGAEAAACRATRAKLPATDLPAEKAMFGDLETQFGKVSVVRGSLHDLDLPAEFTPQTDAQWLIIYCNAVVAWRLTADTETGDSTFTELASRKAAMAQRLQDSGGNADCTPVMKMQTAPPM